MLWDASQGWELRMLEHSGHQRREQAGVPLDVPGQEGLLLGTQACLPPSSPVTSRFALSTGRTTVAQLEASTGPAPPRPGYLRGLVGHHHALPSRHGVIHVLGEVVAFHPDEVAGRG